MFRAWFIVFVLALFCGSVRANEPFDRLQADLEGLFRPGRTLLEVKIATDQLTGPSVLDASALAEVEHLSASLTSFLGAQPHESAHEKLQVLRKFIYVPGPWNSGRPFSYDLADPFGQNTTHKLLAYYLSTRKGNCITMPLLFAILGEHIGLNMSLATAPRHMFVKFTDDSGKVWNLETTSGAGYTRDLHYRRNLPMTDQAVASGLYLRTLSREESIAEIATFVIEQFMRQQRFEDALAASDVVLKHSPKSLYAIIAKGSAAGMILRRDILSRYQSMVDMPPEEKQRAQVLSDQNRQAFARAEALGWTEHDGLKDQWPEYRGQ